MADNSALHAQLEALDHELEEGDITRKGYEKRRTMILSQYLGPQEVERLNTGLRVHSADDSSHPGSEIANNAAAAAAVVVMVCVYIRPRYLVPGCHHRRLPVIQPFGRIQLG